MGLLCRREDPVEHLLPRQIGETLDVIVREGEVSRHRAGQTRLQERRPVVLQNAHPPRVVLAHASDPRECALPRDTEEMSNIQSTS